METWQPCKSPDESHGYPKSEVDFGNTSEAKALPESALSGLWGHLCMGQDDPGGCRFNQLVGWSCFGKDIESSRVDNDVNPFRIYFCCLYNCFHFITYKNVIHHRYGHSSLCTMSILCMHGNNVLSVRLEIAQHLDPSGLRKPS